MAHPGITHTADPEPTFHAFSNDGWMNRMRRGDWFNSWDPFSAISDDEWITSFLSNADPVIEPQLATSSSAPVAGSTNSDPSPSPDAPILSGAKRLSVLPSESSWDPFDVRSPAGHSSTGNTDLYNDEVGDSVRYSDAPTARYRRRYRHTWRKGKVDPKITHKEAERRYRDSVNGALDSLHQILSEGGYRSGPERSVPRMTKGAIITQAVNYIQQLERRQEALKMENQALKRFIPKGLRVLALKAATAGWDCPTSTKC